MSKAKNFFARIVKFFKELRAEMKKVIWPTKKQLINNTTVVLIAIGIIGAAIWALDFVFAQGFRVIVPNTGGLEGDMGVDPGGYEMPIDMNDMGGMEGIDMEGMEGIDIEGMEGIDMEGMEGIDIEGMEDTNTEGIDDLSGEQDVDDMDTPQGEVEE